MSETDDAGGYRDRPGPFPVDELIRTLIATRRAATDEETEQILIRLAAAPFDTATVRVPIKHRGLTYQGRTLGSRADSLFHHLVKRTLVEEQWATGTDADQYLEDLRRAVRWPGARVLVYTRWEEHFAATITPTHEIIPRERRGSRSRPLILVVYSAERRVIVTAYMFTDQTALNLPGDIVWLR